MEIIYENLPEINDSIHLIIESPALNQNKEIIYNNTDQSQGAKNEIIINQNKYKFHSIFKDLEKEKINELILNQINIKNNLTLLFLLNNNKEKNDNDSNYNDEIRNSLKNLFNKDNFEKLKIKNSLYNYYQINLEENKNENIIKDKMINEENNYLLEIPNDENNINISLLKIKIEYSDLNIFSFIQIIFIYNSFEKIIPLFSVNKNENNFILLKEKINNLLLLEKDIKEKINNLPIINEDYLQSIQVFGQETLNYYDNFLKNIENFEKIEKPKKGKNSLSDILKECKNILNAINNEQFKKREKDCYDKYIQIYSNINTQNNETNSNNYNYKELKNIINRFNNLNEELIEILENEKEKENKGDKNNTKIIDDLKNKITKLENDLKEEKSKYEELKNKSSNKHTKNRSMSDIKYPPQKENNISNTNIRLDEENRNLKKKIDELKETISKLKANNDSLFRTNEKLLKEKNNLKNELLKEKNYVTNDSIDKFINNELDNSPTKIINQPLFNTTAKKTKKMNKTKTSMEPLFNSHSILILKKIQDENKELAKQLKDFNSKNFQLELSIKGINNGDVNNNTRSRMSNTSMLSNFTNNTRTELKNIEKKYVVPKK